MLISAGVPREVGELFCDIQTMQTPLPQYAHLHSHFAEPILRRDEMELRRNQDQALRLRLQDEHPNFMTDGYGPFFSSTRRYFSSTATHSVQRPSTLDRVTLLNDLTMTSPRMSSVAARVKDWSCSWEKNPRHQKNNDYHFIRRFMTDADPIGVEVIKFLDDSWRSSLDIQLLVIRRNITLTSEFVYQNDSQALYVGELVVRRGASDARFLSTCDEVVQNYLPIIRLAVLQNTYCLAYVSEAHKRNKELMMFATVHDCRAFRFASNELNCDPFYLCEVLTFVPAAYKYLHLEAKKTRVCALTAMRHDANMVQFATPFHGCKLFALQAVSEHPWTYVFFDEEVRNDLSVQLLVVTKQFEKDGIYAIENLENYLTGSEQLNDSLQLGFEVVDNISPKLTGFNVLSYVYIQLNDFLNFFSLFCVAMRQNNAKRVPKIATPFGQSSHCASEKPRNRLNMLYLGPECPIKDNILQFLLPEENYSFEHIYALSKAANSLQHVMIPNENNMAQSAVNRRSVYAEMRHTEDPNWYKRVTKKCAQWCFSPQDLAKIDKQPSPATMTALLNGWTRCPEKSCAPPDFWVEDDRMTLRDRVRAYVPDVIDLTPDYESE